MAKLPAFQFYPGDWMKDPALRSCSAAARGLWMDMLCLMFESDRRGFLQAPNGTPYSHEQLARMTGCLPDEVSRLLAELETSGVFSRTKDGSIFSRRLKRDEENRADHRMRQHKYRNSQKTNQNSDAEVTPDVTRLSQPSSSSTSSSIQNETTHVVSSAPSPEGSPPKKLVGTLPLTSGPDFQIHSIEIAEWGKLYPGIDVRQECRNMKGWLLANPTRRKTPKGILKFIHNWLSRAQDRSPSKGDIHGARQNSRYDKQQQGLDNARDVAREILGDSRSFDGPDDGSTRDDDQRGFANFHGTIIEGEIH